MPASTYKICLIWVYFLGRKFLVLAGTLKAEDGLTSII
jgi:hypothetical protein